MAGLLDGKVDRPTGVVGRLEGEVWLFEEVVGRVVWEAGRRDGEVGRLEEWGWLEGAMRFIKNQGPASMTIL